MSGASTLLDFRRWDSPQANVTAPVRKSSATWMRAASSSGSSSASGSPAAATAFLFRLCVPGCLAEGSMVLAFFIKADPFPSLDSVLGYF